MITLQFVPYTEIKTLDSDDRISKLLRLVKKEQIVLLEGRLTQTEEAELIKRTMEEQGKKIKGKFRGIELSVVYPENKEDRLLNRLRLNFLSFILGNQQGFTIIGPATVIKEIKREPKKIQLYLKK